MKYAWLGCLLFWGGLLVAGTQDSEFNVNSRYTVESVVISTEGWSLDVAADRGDGRVTSTLRKDAAALVGEKLNPTMLEEIGRRLRKEFHARSVEHHVLRGKTPDYVQVVYDVKLRPARFDLSVPKFLYSNKQTWSGELDATATLGHHGFTVGAISDGDELAERYSGMVARYENNKLGSDRVRFRFAFEDFRNQWNPATESVAEAGGLYRARQNFQPEVTFQLSRPLTLTVGASFERMQDAFAPSQTESANSIVSSLRYHRRLEGAESQHDLDAGYSLRAATQILGSDLSYARHRLQFRYMLTRGKTVVIDDLTAGAIAGQAPMFERFVLGNASFLRGWNKFDLDPMGGSRVVHNSVEYRYGIFQAFYDSGAIWDRNDSAILRHSAGIGIRQGVFSLAVAFPLREGHIDPIFMVGMNY